MFNLGEGFDFECVYNYGDGSFDFFGKNCYNKIYFLDGVIIDKMFFINFEFKFKYNYFDVGFYIVYVNCLNRLSKINFIFFVVV